MKAKFALLAAVKRKRITIPLRKGAVPPVGATRFYVRYTDETGKRHDDPIGPDFEYAGGCEPGKPVKNTNFRATGEAFSQNRKLTPKSVKGTPLASAYAGLPSAEIASLPTWPPVR